MFSFALLLAGTNIIAVGVTLLNKVILSWSKELTYTGRRIRHFSLR